MEDAHCTFLMHVQLPERAAKEPALPATTNELLVDLPSNLEPQRQIQNESALHKAFLSFLAENSLESPHGGHHDVASSYILYLRVPLLPLRQA